MEGALLSLSTKLRFFIQKARLLLESTGFQAIRSQRAYSVLLKLRPGFDYLLEKTVYKRLPVSAINDTVIAPATIVTLRQCKPFKNPQPR
jgi:hypothetical protein